MSPFIAHRFERSNTPFIACPPGLDSLSDPDFFLGEFPIKEFVGGLLRRELFLSETQKARISAGELMQLATIDFGNLINHLFKEMAVVGHQQQRPSKFLKRLLKPLNGRNIQVVCRLIQQQDFRFFDQRSCQSDALAPAAGQVAHDLASR